MDRISCEIPVDELPTVHPGNETSSSEDPATDTGRQQDKEEDILSEETYGGNSAHPPFQSQTEQTDGPVVKGTVDKRYKCEQCDFSTGHKGNLEKHMSEHTGEKPYMCGVCGYRTTEGSHLTIHKRKHTGQKPYKCDQCDYSASRKGHLEEHMSKHTGEKPYMCGECGYRTADRRNLSRHMKKHTGERLFKCDQCDYSATQKVNLDTHMASKHTGHKPYVASATIQLQGKAI
ncbi:hypothetical protein Bbelb_415880 [Branchiostoma belcheri]|nr:hypothetical protein Bbelb_415880 [Branchiostoma belcheri]